jgi:PAS domain S-box-containing protein
MKAIRKLSGIPKKLRARAEKLLATARRDVSQLPVDDAQKLAHELQVHQIELEMQNDELRRTQLGLEEALDRYADLFDFAPVAHLTLEADGEILEANLAAGELLGLERGRLIHQKFARFVPAEAQDTFYLLCQRVFSSDTRQSAELDLAGAQTKRVTVHIEAAREATSLRKQARFSFVDITERKQAEEELRRSEERYRNQYRLLRTLIDLAPDFIFVKDTESRYLVVNESLAKCYGRQPAEMLNRTDADFLPPESAARCRAGEEQALAADTFRTFDDTITLPDGQRREVLTNMVAFRDQQGKVGGLVGIGHDITERKRAENALRTSERNLRILTRALEQSPASILITSTKGEIEYVNPKFTEITGYSPDEVMGKNPRLLKSGHQSLEFYKEMWATITSGRDWHGELCNRKKDGTLFWESAVIAPIHDEHGTVTHFVALKEDITERRRLEAELLEVADREQQRIGHDLHDGLGQRLTALEMKSFLLVEDLAGDNRAAQWRKLQKQAQHISQALQECITVTRSIAHGLAPVVLKTEGLTGALEQLAQRTRIPGRVQCTFICRRPVTIENLQTGKHLYRIAQEAVNNALKHARAGRICINLAHTKGLLSLQIKDDGRGLPARRKSKSGLGMDVMQHRAHAIGATLVIDSKPGQGVSVTCALPLIKQNYGHQKTQTRAG